MNNPFVQLIQGRLSELSDAVIERALFEAEGMVKGFGQRADEAVNEFIAEIRGDAKPREGQQPDAQ